MKAGADSVDLFISLKTGILKKFKKKKVAELWELFCQNKDNTKFLESIRKQLNFEFITSLLINYNGTQSRTDITIFECLRFFEQVVHFNLRPLYPLVFGPNTAEHYSNLIKLGRAIHICPKPDAVLAGLDATNLWATGLELAKFDPNSTTQEETVLYDPRFIGYLLLEMVDAGTDLTLRKFVELNGLSFGFFMLSHKNDDIRALGYGIVGDFFFKLQDLTTESFEERPLYVYLLNYVKTNSKKVNDRISTVVAHFLARASKIFLTPEHPVFPKICSFLFVKSDFDFHTVPEFLRMFLSTSTMAFKEERQWILELVIASMHSADDYQVFSALNGPSLCLSLVATPLCDRKSMTLIFYLLRKFVAIPVAAKDLCARLNFHSWMVATIQLRSFTRWEIGFLAQIFVEYVKQVKSTSPYQKPSVAGSALRKELLIKATIRTMLDYVNKVDDDVKEKWSEELTLLTSSWSQSRENVKVEENGVH